MHVSAQTGEPTVFEHAAVFYRDADDLLASLVPFVLEGVACGEPVLLALPPVNSHLMQSALGGAAEAVTWVDMMPLGANPARIIPEWRTFVDRAGGRRARGVGEPVWPGRRRPELAEAALHEALLNVAFDQGPAWTLLCPYDVTGLPEDVVEEAGRTHRHTLGAGPDAAYPGSGRAEAMFREPLPVAPARADRVRFGRDDLSGLRDLVAALARSAGVRRPAADDLVAAAHEVATNSVVHGGGSGELSAWRVAGAFVVEVTDAGIIDDVLVGRAPARTLGEGGRGVWMANRLCDLVQVRSSDDGTAVRLYAWL